MHEILEGKVCCTIKRYPVSVYQHPWINVYMCNSRHCSVNAVLEIRSKWWSDKRPSSIILGQTISDLLGQTLGIPMTW